MQSLDFESDPLHSVQYAMVAAGGGSAVRADAQVLWAPARSRQDLVPTAVTAVEVLIVRSAGGHHRAPTVRRTLTGAAAAELVTLVDSLPRAIPGAYHCPAEIAGDDRVDRLMFRSAGPAATFVVKLAGCAGAELTVGDRPPIQLSHTFPGAIDDVDRAILAVLRLPPGYGR
jgi:hypothetical protein